MGKRASEAGPQQKRFAAYMQGLAKAAGHADREIPLKNYCTGLLLPGERKSVTDGGAIGSGQCAAHASIPASCRGGCALE
jgi:SRSO17 transposase